MICIVSIMWPIGVITRMDKRYILEQILKAAEEYYDHMCHLDVPSDVWEADAWDEVFEAEQALYNFDLNETEGVIK